MEPDKSQSEPGVSLSECIAGRVKLVRAAAPSPASITPSPTTLRNSRQLFLKKRAGWQPMTSQLAMPTTL
jgi:hypothetical protein